MVGSAHTSLQVQRVAKKPQKMRYGLTKEEREHINSRLKGKRFTMQEVVACNIRNAIALREQKQRQTEEKKKKNQALKRARNKGYFLSLEDIRGIEEDLMAPMEPMKPEDVVSFGTE